MSIVDADKYARPKGYWEQIVGTRGFKGEKTTHSFTMANHHLEIEGSVKVEKIKKERPKPVLLSGLFEEE
jgi:hypothetical protein